MLKYFFALLGFLLFKTVSACSCKPPERLVLTELAAYDVIFKGRVTDKEEACTEAVYVTFKIDEQYFGDVLKEQVLQYDCSSSCAMSFEIGDEWLIYAEKNNALDVIVSLCSRSRKFFENVNEDFYTYSLGNTYLEEIDFLRSNFEVNQSFKDELQVIKYEKVPVSKIPWLLGSSIVFMIVGYLVFNKLTKKK